MFDFLRRRPATPEIEEKGVTLASPAAFELFGAPSASGFSGGADAALKCAPVSAGVKLISESFALCSPSIYSDPDGGDGETAADHPLNRVMSAPNPWSSATEFYRQLATDLILFGNAYIRIVRVRRTVRELHRVDPRSCAVEIDQTSGEPSYRATLATGEMQSLSYREIAHVKAISVDGYSGLGLLHLGNDAIGAALAMEAHAAGLFGRAARPAGILEVGGRLTQDMLDRLRASFSSIYGGSGNAGRTAILESGTKFVPMQLTSTDAQFLENRKFQVIEIARHLNIPSVLLNDLERATFSNAEHLSQQFLDRTLMPIVENFEDVFTRTLLTEAERDAGLEVEFDTENFIRADTAARFAAYRSAIEAGFMLINEARDKEGLPPVEGGDQPTRSVQVVPLNPAPTQDIPDGT